MATYVVRLKGGQQVEVESDSSDQAAIQTKIAAGQYKTLPTLTAAQRIVRSSAPSIIGGALGATAGGLAAPFTGGLSIPIGAALGASAGEAVQQFANPLGEGRLPADPTVPPQAPDRSLLQVGLAGATSLAGPALGVARRAISVPAIQSALTAVVGKRGENLVELFAPSAQQVRQMFAAATTAGRAALIKPTALGQAVTDVRKSLSQSELTAPGALIESLKGAEVLVQRGGARLGGGVGWDNLRATMSDIGDRIGQLQRAGNKKAAQKVKHLYASIWKDIDTAGQGASTELHVAIDGFKREKAGEFITGSFKRRIGVSPAGEDLMNVRGVIDRLNKNEDLLARFLPSDDLVEIKTILQRFAAIENQPAKAAGSVSSLPGVLGGAGAGAAIGTAAERAMGGSGAIGGALGTAVGAQVPRLASGAQAVGSMLTSAPGRAIIGQLADQGVTWDQLVSAAAQAVRAEPGASFEAGVGTLAETFGGVSSLLGGRETPP